MAVALKVTFEDRQFLSRVLFGVVDESAEEVDPFEPVEGSTREYLQIGFDRRHRAWTARDRQEAVAVQVDPVIRSD